MGIFQGSKTMNLGVGDDGQAVIDDRASIILRGLGALPALQPGGPARNMRHVSESQDFDLEAQCADRYNP